MAKVGVLGASGYTGAELLRLLAAHPELDVAYLTADSSARTRVGDLYPSLATAYVGATYSRYDPAAVDGLDAVFCALPHGEALLIVPDLVKRVGHVIDLSADFRLRDASLYPQWYGHEHSSPALLADAAFGIPELFREQLVGAALVAVAGCYVTAAALALAPFARAGAIDSVGVIVDAASGVSGAGKAPKATTSFGAANEDFTAYALLDHRHTPEIEQATGAQILFTPHLAPMTRGILATCYARPTSEFADSSRERSSLLRSTADALAVLRDFYESEPFVHVLEEPPSTKSTLGSNCAHLTARVDPRTGWLMVLCALDNLVKGASGQAIQCANLALGLRETTGLPTVAVYP